MLTEKGISKVHTLSGLAKEKFKDSKAKLIIIGASGWLGMSTLELLKQAVDNLDHSVFCFGSKVKNLTLFDGTKITQSPLSELSSFPKKGADYLLNFAFLTKEKAEILSKDKFREINSTISKTVSKEASRIGVKNICTISTGGVYLKDQILVDDFESSPYGFLKLQEEKMFSKLAEQGAKVVIPRVFNISGPYTNKDNLYMLPSLISQALNSRSIEILSKKKIYRSYVGISDLLSTIFGCMILMESGNSVIYDTCGISKVEIGELAEIIRDLLNKDAKILRPEVDKESEQDIYIGSRAKIKSLISELKINESSLEDQILCTAQYLKAILK